MCGIAGYFSSEKYDKKIIEDMVATLYHRGPDASGFYSNKNYSAGMRRLSINDLSTGNQPLYNEDKSIVLFYNGEIYNFQTIKKDLENRGHKFRTNSDGEVICHLYEEVGWRLFEQLDGMFAAALWSEHEQKLILARDLPGEKPLYYSVLPDNGVAFASEIKSLIKFPSIKKDLDYQSIWDLPTFLWIPEPNTIYKNIKALLPGQVLIIDSNSIESKLLENKFDPWNLKKNYNQQELVDLVRQTVSQAVTSRLLSDVPVGAFLSGGLDSSIIATLASRQLPELSTFTIGFEDLTDPYHGRSDESSAAEAYAKILGTKHFTIKVTADDFRKKLEDFVFYGDQPQAISSGLGVLSIAEAAHQAGIKVLLTGDGADECFGGYSWYEYLNNNYPPTPTTNQSLSWQNFGLSLTERLAAINSYPDSQKAWAWHYYASEAEKTGLFNPEMFRDCQKSNRWFTDYKPDGLWSAEDYIKQDRLFYFPNEMLKKADRLTMAYSVEGRPPFAAPAILALANHLKSTDLIKAGQLKWVLRQAFKDILPAEIINRPKHGFNVPIDAWLANEWVDLFEETFSNDSALAKLNIISNNSGSLAKSMLNDKARLNGHTIFCFIVLNLWLKNNYL